ncbi:hypothetical protein [Devosia sp. DBB001]|nr:hypothetical protein [Devosia sp. DBB001]
MATVLSSGRRTTRERSVIARLCHSNIGTQILPNAFDIS